MTVASNLRKSESRLRGRGTADTDTRDHERVDPAPVEEHPPTPDPGVEATEYEQRITLDPLCDRRSPVGRVETVAR